jgi:hypothetical protein
MCILAVSHYFIYMVKFIILSILDYQLLRQNLKKYYIYNGLFPNLEIYHDF